MPVESNTHHSRHVVLARPEACESNSVPATPVRRRHYDAAATRSALLSAATKLFAEKGYDRTTLRDIADTAGANQALIGRYFGSKKQLFLEATGPRIDTDAVLSGPLENLGQHLGEEALRWIDGTFEENQLLMLLRSSGNPYAAPLLREQAMSSFTTPSRERLDGDTPTCAPRLLPVASWRSGCFGS